MLQQLLCWYHTMKLLLLLLPGVQQEPMDDTIISATLLPGVLQEPMDDTIVSATLLPGVQQEPMDDTIVSATLLENPVSFFVVTQTQYD